MNMGKLTVRHAVLRFVMVDDSTAGFNFLNETDKFYNIVRWNYGCTEKVHDNIGQIWVDQSIQIIYDNIIEKNTTFGRDSDAVLRNYSNKVYAFDFGANEGKVRLVSKKFSKFSVAPPLIFSETVPYIEKAKDKNYHGYETILNAIGISYTNDSGTMIAGNRQFLSKVVPYNTPVLSLGYFYSTPSTILKLKKVEPAERGRLGSNLDYRDHHILELVDYINNNGDVKFTLDYYQDQFLKDYGFISDDKKKQQLVTNLFQKL